jgi:putative addiction module killer protein
MGCAYGGRELEVLYYRTELDVLPFRNWRSSIVDDHARAAVDARIARFRGGNFGSSRSLGGGVSESKIDFGPGYRIYYGVEGDKVVLLFAGDKSTQAADIKRAKRNWDDYKKREKKRKDAERAEEALEHAKLQRRPHKRSKS